MSIGVFGAEAERVELVDPGVVARLGAARIGDAFQLRQRLGIERPAFGAVLAGRRRPVQRPLALAAIEAGQVAARERRPDDAVAIDVHAARREARVRRIVERRLVDFGERGLRRIRPGIEPDDGAGKPEHRCPRSIRRAPAPRRRTPPPKRLSFAGSTGWFGSTYASRLPLPLVSMMSAVQPCDFTSSCGLVEHLRVQPADDLAAAARPQRVVGVLGEHQVVRAEAGADVRELLASSDRTRRAGGRRCSIGNSFADG